MGVVVPGSSARDSLWAVAGVPSAAGWLLLGAFQQEVSDSSNTSQLGSASGAGCVRLSALPL